MALSSAVDLRLLDFFVPETIAAFQEFFTFDVDDPADPGTYIPMRDVAFTWDESTGLATDPVMCQKSANPKHEQFRDLGGWHGRSSPITSHTLTEIRSGP